MQKALQLQALQKDAQNLKDNMASRETMYREDIKKVTFKSHII